MTEALYRKYRPQTFDDVVGQIHIERTIKNALESDRVSHAYLFCGPRGTGKTTMARLLAKALLCEKGPTPAPDGECEQCLAIAEGTHPDVNEMDAASRTGVENVREEIIGRVQFAPVRGRYKIYIIDEVHMLSTAAFNALLKTLEEPPSHVVFILCTTDPHKVPATIHSRCQRFDFHRLANEEIIARLGAVCASEGVEFEAEALELAAKRAQGGMRDALTTLEQLIAFGEGRVTMQVALDVLGALDSNDMTDIVARIARRDAAACFTWVAEYVETGADLAQFARDLASYVRDLYAFILTDGALEPRSSATNEQLAAQAGLFGPDRLAHVLSILGDVCAELRSSANPRLSFEIALTRMARPESDLTLASLAARVEELERACAQGARPVDAPAVRVAASTLDSTPVADAPMGASAVADAPSASGLSPSVIAAARAIKGGGAPSSAPVVDTGAPASATSDAPGSGASSGAAAAAPAERIPAVQSGLDSSPAPAADSPSASEPKLAFSSAGPSEAVRAKLSNPAALQRGWQAAVAEVKNLRTAYGALLLSASVSPVQGASGLAVEFSRENSFAFSAVQKPEVSEMVSAALAHAFGGEVPFEFTQGGGRPQGSSRTKGGDSASSASVPGQSRSSGRAGMSAAERARAAMEAARARGDMDASVAPAFDRATTRPMPIPSSALRPAVAEAAAPPEGDAVPYSDADAESYADEAAAHAVLTVDGAKPVDPAEAGRRLGFDSMVPARSEEMPPLAGWPMPEDAVGTSGPAQEKASVPEPSAKRAPHPSAMPERKAPASSASASASADSDPAAPGVSGQQAGGRPRPSDAESRTKSRPRPPAPAPEPAQDAGMDAASIFSALGVSLDDVQESS